MYFVERSIHLIEEHWLLKTYQKFRIQEESSIVYCDSAVSYGPKL